MKKWVGLVAGILVSFNSWGAQETWAGIQKQGTIRLATEGAFAPFNYFQGKTLTGFEVELGTEIAKRMGVKSDWKAFPFDSLLIGLNQDRFDLVLASHGVTAEREKAVDFSQPHYCTGGQIVSLAGGPKTVADLAGKTIAVQVGTTYLDHVRQVKGVKEVKTYPRDTDCLQNLMTGHVDVWITDKFAAKAAIQANGANKFSTGDMLFQERVAMAVAKGNKDLLAAVNSALVATLQDGTYSRLSQKYFGEDIRCQ
jgi:polar amino acid transport system substrate-binding protein